MVGNTSFGLAYWWANLGKVFQMETPQGFYSSREQEKDVDSGYCWWAFALAHHCCHCPNQKEEKTMRPIRWKKAVEHHVESHCDRFKITPLYWGGVDPVEYQLWFLGKKAGLFSLQREAKAGADRLRGLKPGESRCMNSMDGKHVFNNIGKNDGKACIRCSRLKVDIERIVP